MAVRLPLVGCELTYKPDTPIHLYDITLRHLSGNIYFDSPTREESSDYNDSYIGRKLPNSLPATVLLQRANGGSESTSNNQFTILTLTHPGNAPFEVILLGNININPGKVEFGFEGEPIGGLMPLDRILVLKSNDPILYVRFIHKENCSNVIGRMFNKPKEGEIKIKCEPICDVDMTVRHDSGIMYSTWLSVDRNPNSCSLCASQVTIRNRVNVLRSHYEGSLDYICCNPKAMKALLSGYQTLCCHCFELLDRDSKSLNTPEETMGTLFQSELLYSEDPVGELPHHGGGGGVPTLRESHNSTSLIDYESGKCNIVPTEEKVSMSLDETGTATSLGLSAHVTQRIEQRGISGQLTVRTLRSDVTYGVTGKVHIDDALIDTQSGLKGKVYMYIDMTQSVGRPINKQRRFYAELGEKLYSEWKECKYIAATHFNVIHGSVHHDFLWIESKDFGFMCHIKYIEGSDPDKDEVYAVLDICDEHDIIDSDVGSRCRITRVWNVYGKFKIHSAAIASSIAAKMPQQLTYGPIKIDQHKVIISNVKSRTMPGNLWTIAPSTVLVDYKTGVKSPDKLNTVFPYVGKCLLMDTYYPAVHLDITTNSKSDMWGVISQTIFKYLVDESSYMSWPIRVGSSKKSILSVLDRCGMYITISQRDDMGILIKQSPLRRYLKEMRFVRLQDTSAVATKNDFEDDGLNQTIIRIGADIYFEKGDTIAQMNNECLTIAEYIYCRTMGRDGNFYVYDFGNGDTCYSARNKLPPSINAKQGTLSSRLVCGDRSFDEYGAGVRGIYTLGLNNNGDNLVDDCDIIRSPACYMCHRRAICRSGVCPFAGRVFTYATNLQGKMVDIGLSKDHELGVDYSHSKQPYSIINRENGDLIQCQTGGAAMITYLFTAGFVLIEHDEDDKEGNDETDEGDKVVVDSGPLVGGGGGGQNAAPTLIGSTLDIITKTPILKRQLMQENVKTLFGARVVNAKRLSEISKDVKYPHPPVLVDSKYPLDLVPYNSVTVDYTLPRCSFGGAGAKCGDGSDCLVCYRYGVWSLCGSHYDMLKSGILELNGFKSKMPDGATVIKVTDVFPSRYIRVIVPRGSRAGVYSYENGFVASRAPAVFKTSNYYNTNLIKISNMIDFKSRVKQVLREMSGEEYDASNLDKVIGAAYRCVLGENSFIYGAIIGNTNTPHIPLRVTGTYDNSDIPINIMGYVMNTIITSQIPICRYPSTIYDRAGIRMTVMMSVPQEKYWISTKQLLTVAGLEQSNTTMAPYGFYARPYTLGYLKAMLFAISQPKKSEDGTITQEMRKCTRISICGTVQGCILHAIYEDGRECVAAADALWTSSGEFTTKVWTISDLSTVNKFIGIRVTKSDESFSEAEVIAENISNVMIAGSHAFRPWTLAYISLYRRGYVQDTTSIGSIELVQTYRGYSSHVMKE